MTVYVLTTFRQQKHGLSIEIMGVYKSKDARAVGLADAET